MRSDDVCTAAAMIAVLLNLLILLGGVAMLFFLSVHHRDPRLEIGMYAVMLIGMCRFLASILWAAWEAEQNH